MSSEKWRKMCEEISEKLINKRGVSNAKFETPQKSMIISDFFGFTKCDSPNGCYSVLRATTGSFLAALREGISPEISVRKTDMPTRMTAAPMGRKAFRVGISVSA